MADLTKNKVKKLPQFSRFLNQDSGQLHQTQDQQTEAYLNNSQNFFSVTC